MNILVTVGTTPFDRLIKAADLQLGNSNHQVVAQISEGEYEPVHSEYFRFSGNIESYFKKSELVISHGGAGSIYRLLELRKKIIIVPNLDRVDAHQTDICNYMENNHHALACIDLACLKGVVEQVASFDFVPFHPVQFKGVANLREYLGLPRGTR